MFRVEVLQKAPMQVHSYKLVVEGRECLGPVCRLVSGMKQDVAVLFSRLFQSFTAQPGLLAVLAEVLYGQIRSSKVQGHPEKLGSKEYKIIYNPTRTIAFNNTCRTLQPGLAGNSSVTSAAARDLSLILDSDLSQAS